MEIKEANAGHYLMEHRGVTFEVACPRDEAQVELVGTSWNDLAVDTNTHPEALLELISEAIYRFNQEEKSNA